MCRAAAGTTAGGGRQPGSDVTRLCLAMCSLLIWHGREHDERESGGRRGKSIEGGRNGGGARSY